MFLFKPGYVIIVEQQGLFRLKSVTSTFSVRLNTNTIVNSQQKHGIKPVEGLLKKIQWPFIPWVSDHYLQQHIHQKLSFSLSIQTHMPKGKRAFCFGISCSISVEQAAIMPKIELRARIPTYLPIIYLSTIFEWQY